MVGALMDLRQKDIKVFCIKCKTYHRVDDPFACILSRVVG